MTTVATIAEKHPDRLAVVYGHGETSLTYGDLEQRSRRLAHVLRRLGLRPGDCVAAYVANDDVFFDLYWACHRTGLFFTPVNWHLQRDEVAYIVDNSDAKVLVAHARFAEIAAEAARGVPRLVRSLSVGGEIPGFAALEEEVAAAPADLGLDDPLEGSVMLYSSGTTGRPKGVRRPLTGRPAGDTLVALLSTGLLHLFGITEDDRYLTPAPLYHAAPLLFTSAQMRLGSTSYVMRRFDAEDALRMIQDYRITASQWVPTHFRRLLQLPEDVRRRYDVQSRRPFFGQS